MRPPVINYMQIAGFARLFADGRHRSRIKNYEFDEKRFARFNF